MTINFASKTIEMTKAESKAAGKFGSEAYKELTSIKKEFPTYEVQVIARSSGKKFNDFKGLTYTYMEAYIERHDDEAKSIMAEYKMLRGQTAEAEDALAASFSYQEMKKWFLGRFKEIEAFHQTRQDVLAAVK